TYPAHQIVHAVWKALGQAVPEKACAGWSRASHCNTSGKNADGRYYVAYQWLGMPGAGAVDGRDGFETLGHMATLGGLTLPDVETFEVDYPFHVRRNELRLDGGGPGRYRGGTGALVEVEILQPAEFSYRGEGSHIQTSFGVAGGQAGDEGACTIIFPDGRIYRPPAYGVRRLGPLCLTISSAGGGGFGDPYMRDPERVRLDVLDSLVSLDSASKDYGVTLGSSPEFKIDEEATRSRRAKSSNRQI